MTYQYKSVWLPSTHEYSRSDPDSKVHGAHMGPIWGGQDPGGPHVGPMNLAIWGFMTTGQGGQQSTPFEVCN